MKLLFDQNVSPRLAERLADLFPGSVHVFSIGLDCAIDDKLWEFARQGGICDRHEGRGFQRPLSHPQPAAEGNLAAAWKLYDG